MKIAYFDCFAGASGDMILGALVDAGVSLEYLRTELAKLSLTGYELQSRKIVKGGLSGTQVLVLVEGQPEAGSADHSPGASPLQPESRRLADIQELISNSGLSATVQEKSLAIFSRLVAAEAKVHQTTSDRIYFYEVGALDAIVDIVGAVIGLEALGIDRIYCSPLQVGGGTVRCAHGILPVPTPATLELIRGYQIFTTGIQGELLTLTGAAILTTLAEPGSSLPAMTVEAVGYGAGYLDLPLPNLLRLVIGRESQEAAGYLTETVAVLETNIDDMNPQLYDYLIQRLLDLGALDVFMTPIQMKKTRPGVLLTVLCPPALVATCAAFLWRETTTIGLRWRHENRYKLPRKFTVAPTRFGPISFKISYLEGRPVQITPEYEDCKRLALEQGVPLLQVLEEARAVALTLNPEQEGQE